MIESLIYPTSHTVISVRPVNQTQTQSQTQIRIPHIEKIFQSLKQFLPLEAYKFKQIVEQKLEFCEFWYDTEAEPSKTIELAENILIEKFEKEFNTLICEGGELTVIFKNSIYLDNIKTNTMLLIDFDVEVILSE